ncbi:MAG: hypothetical protein Q8P18_00480 [Pseudomonadota bacterium]|nr:hypothetical protein [Pseudomonadota bacterium]
MPSTTLLLALALFACGGETASEKDQATAQPNGQPTPAPDTTPSVPPTAIAVADLRAEAENIALVPSPAEMQKALEKAGVAGGLSALVTDRAFKMDVANKDIVAVRTGVLLADALLTVKDAPKEQLVARLEKVKVGMTALGAGPDIAATIDELNNKIMNDVASRDELLKELDELHGVMIPEIKYEAGERVVPLIQAGSWLEGSNLISNAILTSQKIEAANSLLRQPQVAGYFLKYVQVEGADKAPAEVLGQLETTLKKLQEIASKPALSTADVTEIKAQTDSVLTLL